MKISERDIAAGAFLLVLAGAGLYLNLDHSLGSARRMGPGYMPMLVFVLQAALGGLVVFGALVGGPDPLDERIGRRGMFAGIGAAIAVAGALSLAVMVGTGDLPARATETKILGVALLAGLLGLFYFAEGTYKAVAGSFIAGGAAGYVASLLPGFFSQGYNPIGFGFLGMFAVMAFSTPWRLIAWVNASMCVFALLLEKGGLMAACIGTVAVAAVADPMHHRKPLGVIGMIIFLSALCWWIFIKQLDIRVAVWPQF